MDGSESMVYEYGDWLKGGAVCENGGQYCQESCLEID